MDLLIQELAHVLMWHEGKIDYGSSHGENWGQMLLTGIPNTKGKQTCLILILMLCPLSHH